MGETFEKARVFAKKVTEVLGKADGDRFKCPRCKGSGFNTGHQVWNWNQSSATTESCWFCEGVGVMPVIGLNGFMFGRSKPLLNTKNVNPLPELPVKLQLYLGKYPETKCTLKSYKPSLKLADLLYNPNQFPSWMNETGGDCTLTSFESSAKSSDRGSFSTLTSTRTKSSEPSMQLVIQTGNNSSNRSRVSISSRNLQQTNSSTSQIPQSSPYRVLFSQGSPASSLSEERTSRRARGAPRRSGSSLLVTVRKTVCTSLSAPMGLSSSPVVHSSSKDGAVDDSKVTRKSPLFRTAKSSKFPRRERNRVREEAEKEAVERAYKFQNPRTPQLEARSSPVSEYTDSRQPGGDKMEHLSNVSVGGTGSVNGPNSVRRMITTSRKASSDSTTINQLALGKVKDGIIRTPALGKTF